MELRHPLNDRMDAAITAAPDGSGISTPQRPRTKAYVETLHRAFVRGAQSPQIERHADEN